MFPLICSVLMTCAVGATGTAPAPQPHETASQAQPTQTAPAVRPIDTFPDTWAASDALGRRVVDHTQAGPPRPGKFVGIFYFLWLGEHGNQGPFDITRILARDPDAMSKPDSPLWGPMHHPHHWGEPLFGYYLSDDAWVIAKHAQMLSDAGVDVIIFDVTNQVTYRKNYTRLCEVFTRLRAAGRRTPQIAFLTPFWDPRKVVAELYADLYRPGKFPDLWFQWKGKPLILADPNKVPDETRDFFTFRKPQPNYFQGPTGPNQWGWLEIYPQHVFHDETGRPEQMTVGVAQNASGRRLCAFSEKDTYGRSWHDGAKDERPDAVLYGFNFAEQWKRALEVDPEFIFITGWNEWIAGRFAEFNKVREPVMFVDQFTQEYSRDIEPMKNREPPLTPGHGDNYYYQMVSYIRRFKGVRPPPAAGAPKTIAIDGDFGDWADVQPEYRDDAEDTMHRNHGGCGSAGPYVNTTGRNDFVALKVARDATHLYFYARTAAPITPREDEKWMLLLIDADAEAQTGWCGYDFVINRRAQDGERVYVETIAPAGPEGGVSFGAAGQARKGIPAAEDARKDTRTSEVSGKVGDGRTSEALLRINGSELELAVPRTVLGLTDGSPAIHIHFKWADNIALGDPLAFTTDGDTAPNARFNYVYRGE